MAKSKSPSAILKQKENKLDWNKFNFLENMLIFCTEPTRQVPKESGVHFLISASPEDNAICVLFKTDRQPDYLIEQKPGQKRPDYMALYVKKDQCICTIIEMKGTDAKKLKRGIEQIRQLKTRLQQEIRNHLPTKFKITFQGILLTPPNSDIPRKEIAEIKDLEILPLQYPHKFELFEYVSRKIYKTEKYNHKPGRKNNLNFIEELLMKQALPERIKDSIYHKYSDFICKKEGIYINYAHPEKDSYAVLFANNDDAVIATSEDNFRKQIREELRNIGGDKKINFEKYSLLNKIVISKSQG